MEKSEERSVPARFSNVQDALRFLCFHPLFRDEQGGPMFEFCRDDEFEWTHPAVGRVEGDEPGDAKLRVILRCTPWDTSRSPDFNVESIAEAVAQGTKRPEHPWCVSAPSYDEALIKLANLVYADCADENFLGSR